MKHKHLISKLILGLTIACAGAGLLLSSTAHADDSDASNMYPNIKNRSSFDVPFAFKKFRLLKIPQIENITQGLEYEWNKLKVTANRQAVPLLQLLVDMNRINPDYYYNGEPVIIADYSDTIFSHASIPIRKIEGFDEYGYLDPKLLLQLSPPVRVEFNRVRYEPFSIFIDTGKFTYENYKKDLSFFGGDFNGLPNLFFKYSVWGRLVGSSMRGNTPVETCKLDANSNTDWALENVNNPKVFDLVLNREGLAAALPKQKQARIDECERNEDMPSYTSFSMFAEQYNGKTYPDADVSPSSSLADYFKFQFAQHPNGVIDFSKTPTKFYLKRTFYPANNISMAVWFWVEPKIPKRTYNYAQFMALPQIKRMMQTLNSFKVRPGVFNRILQAMDDANAQAGN